MVSSTVSEIFYTGNASLVTSYSVPFPYQSSSHVKVQQLVAGTGTVTITSGAAVFSSAQTTLLTGSRFRVAGVTYTIFSKTSTTVFTLTTEPTVAASAFHILDDATDLVSGSTYTLTEVGVGAPYVTTAPAIPATDLVRVYRELPLTQLTAFPSTGPIRTEDIEDSLDEKTMQIIQVSNRIDDLSILTNAAVSTTANDTTSFANSAARTAATPTRIGQLGVQLDTDTIYRGTATTAGSWTSTGGRGTRYITGDPSAETPDFIGQLLVIAGVVPNAKRQYSVMYAYGTSVGQWRDIEPYKIPFNYTWTPWLAGDPLLPGQKRWVGNFPQDIIAPIQEVFVSCDTAGSGTAKVRVHFPDLATQLTDDPISLLPASAGSGPLHSGYFSTAANSAAAQLFRIEIEVVSTGDPIEVTSTNGSTASTPDSGDLPDLPTGALISSPSHGDAYVVFIRGDGTIVRSHPSAVSGAETLTAGRRIFVRGVTTSLTGGVTTIPATATDLTLINPGDLVIGPSVPPFTVVVSKGATDFEISQPLTGATTLVTVASPSRIPVTHYTVISEAAGQTVIEVPTTATIRVGDKVFGEFVPATAYITSITTDTSFTISSAISGGTATEITVMAPSRVATVTAGTNTATLNHTVGLMIGLKVIGPGVPRDTFITAVASPVITVSNNLTLDLSGASTDLFEFPREVLEITGTTSAASTSMTLPYAVSATPIEVGMTITGDGVLPGTLVASVAGSTVTMSKAAAVAATAQAFRFAAAPAIWSGLQFTARGFLARDPI